MLTPVCQRWRRHRSEYRPRGETIDTRRYDVAELTSDALAKAFVRQHHYARTCPPMRRRYGLYRGDELVGVAAYTVPMRGAVLDPLPRDASLELGRLVLLDCVPANGESFFVAETFRRLRRSGIAGVVSFSDPVERSDAAGARVFGGHIGTVYQALSATYAGRQRPKTIRLLPDGCAVSNRALQKIRSGHRGQRYAIEQLVAAGAEPPSRGRDPVAWLQEWLPRVTRTLRHGGNHKYYWALHRRAALPPSRPYPKAPPRLF